MNKIHQSIAVLGLMLVSLTGCNYEPRAVGDANPARVAEMQQTLRDLWVGHIFWVRHVVSNIATSDSEERDAAEKEVLTNTKQIAHTITPFYGEAASEKFYRLLDGNIGAVEEYSEATAAGNKRQQDAALAHLASNADEIADFLSHLNPYLQKDIVRSLIADTWSSSCSPNQPVQGKGLCTSRGNVADDAPTRLCHCGYIDNGVGEAVSE